MREVVTVAVNVAVLVGSLRKGSLNLRLAKALEKAAPRGMQFSYVPIDEVPHFNQDESEPLPKSVASLKHAIEAADAVIFITPEYNRSVSGVLKNAMDWASRPYGDNSFEGKPSLVAGASPGNISTAVAQQHLRNSLAYLDSPAMDQPEVFIRFVPDDLIDEDGNVTVNDTKKFLEDVMASFASWVETVRSGVIA